MPSVVTNAADVQYDVVICRTENPYVVLILTQDPPW
jgi:hypothetical protein